MLRPRRKPNSAANIIVLTARTVDSRAPWPPDRVHERGMTGATKPHSEPMPSVAEGWNTPASPNEESFNA